MKTVLKKIFRLPPTVLLLFELVIIMGILTWIIPAGEFTREVVNGISMVVPDSFHRVEQVGMGLFEILSCIPAGFTQNADIITMFFAMGGPMEIFNSTKTLESFTSTVKITEGRRGLVIVFFLMLFFSIWGAMGQSIPLMFMPIGFSLAKALRLDAFCAMLMIYLAAYSGFSVGWLAYGTEGIAQTLAGLPMFSGWQPRVILHVINFALVFGYTYYYMKRIKKDPTKSWNYGVPNNGFMDGDTKMDVPAFDLRHKLALLVWAATYAFMFIKAILGGMDTTFMISLMLLQGIAVAIVMGMSSEEATKKFLKGAGGMVGAMCVLGLAGTMNVVMTDGKILDTMVNWISAPVRSVGTGVGAIVMLWVNGLLSAIIPSGLGQCVTVMPIMLPVADLSGISRQVAVLAYQLGDGFCNNIVPTAWVLVAELEMVKVNYVKNAKWILPLIAVELVIASIMLYFLAVSGWTGL